MAGLLESRWAATPEPTLQQQAPAVEEDRTPKDGVFASRWADDTAEIEPRDKDGKAVAEEKPTEGISGSRWADTPEPDPEEQQQQENVQVEKPKDGVFASPWAAASDEASEEQLKPQNTTAKPTDGVFASRWAPTPEPAAEQDASKESAADAQEEATTPVQVSDTALDAQNNGKENEPAKEESKLESTEEPSSVTDPVDAPIDATEPVTAEANLGDIEQTNRPAPTHLEPPRLKKRVSWRGKNIVIAIPRIDYAAAGIPEPMSEAEVEQRMQQFQDAGCNVLGNDLTHEATSDDPAQVRAIFPDETETRKLPPRQQLKVLLPDLEKWRAYTDWLTEQKLAALGVTLGFDEPPPSAVPAQDMSRQSSQQYPPLPFSPPLPTTSAGSGPSRPGLVRGHSHTMSVASPASPLNGPFGHMHRHSTFTGIGLPQLQQPQQPQSPGIPGLQPFSPQQQLALSGLPRGGSPAQISALRQELGSMRGPGSPLNQQMLPQSPQDYSRGLMDDQRRRQHAYSQSMQQPMMSNTFMSQGSSLRPTPALPELPEDEDEEEEEYEEPMQSTYVPPHKRVQANTEIAIPTPRGHRHNISEGLERELLEAEQRQKAASRDWIEVTEEEEQPSVLPFSKPNGFQANRFQNTLPSQPVEKDPLGSEHPVQETAHSRKKSASRFNVAAPSFTFNPGANFQPGASFQPAPTFQQPAAFQPPQSTFTFGAPAPKTDDQSIQAHRRHQSSGSFNAHAPSFKPATSEFSFSSSGPSFKANTNAEQESKKDPLNIVDELPSIFGKIDIPDIVKPARRSKAIAIVRPDESKTPGSGTDFEDDEGRVAQGEAKRKQARKIGDDGDQVPLFAEPSSAPALPVPPEKVLGSNDTNATTTGAEQNGEDMQKSLEAIIEKPDEDASPQPPQETAAAVLPSEPSAAKEPQHKHKYSTSLSALAKPFQPPGAPAIEKESDEKHHDHFNSISELEEGEIREDGSRSVSPIPNAVPDTSRPTGPLEYSSSERIDKVQNHEPSFDEIDAVMRQLNADDSEKETLRDPSPTRLPSPGSHPMKGVTYLAEWSRSDAPSPSPERKQMNAALERTDSGEQDLNGWPQVRQLNRAEEAATSDWSGMLSPPDEEKLHQRSNFFDSHIDSIIGRVVEQRLQPLEESLRHIQNTVGRRNRSSELKLQRSSSNVDSDADDEDDGSDEQKQRPISRGRDKRVDQIKAAVLEALREQSPVRTQTAIDVAELHSVLADMKVSFARAASASLELDDIRAVVEDSLNRQSQAVVPIANDEGKETHRRALSELEGRLNETLAGALEEANHRRAVEERETEARRQLRLAEEEMKLLRDSARDEDSKARAMEQERQDLIDRLDRSEEARRKAEDKLEDAEAEKDALQATLEEYRVSSNKWRQDIDDGKLAREELENTIASMERQNEDYQESSGGMKRRLEKLHSDMATAAGQLASEKAIWKSKEEDYRAKIEVLESQSVVTNRERVQLEDELRIVRANAVGAAESRHTIEHLRATNASLDEMVRKLQGDLTESQVMVVRFERQFHEAQESGRAEVHRTRMTLDTEVEAANNHVNLVRAELETELSRIRTELENAKMEAETAKARHDHLIEEEEAARREALRKVNHSNSVALDEARHKYESAIQELTTQQSRALSQAFEDKERTEGFLREKLALSEAKLQHFQERVAHLEERLEVAKSAAQAAALSAKASKTFSPSPTSSSIGIPEKVSPQALRESILVLQEQLQERESRIERLEAQVQEEGVAKVKDRDTEINWLRELLAVRSEELTELVNTLSRPNFDRATVRDTAIRIRANLQMEQQEKERSSKPPGSLGGQALASLSSLATPRAAQLSSAFNKWRESMESSALKTQQRPGASARSYTPSRVNTKPQPPSRYSSGLMTPPASNLRSSPAAEGSTSLPPPQLNSRPTSKSSAMQDAEPGKPRSRHTSTTSERPSTPLLREQSYDRDADDNGIDMQTFEDDDLEDVADSEPPAFRSLESELEIEGGMDE